MTHLRFLAAMLYAAASPVVPHTVVRLHTSSKKHVQPGRKDGSGDEKENTQILQHYTQNNMGLFWPILFNVIKQDIEWLMTETLPDVFFQNQSVVKTAVNYSIPQHFD